MSDTVQRAVCGGYVHGPYNYRSGFPNGKPQYNWTLTSGIDVHRLLLELLPHLVIKKPEADVAIEYLESRWK